MNPGRFIATLTMLNSPYTPIVILTCLLLAGCGDGDTSRETSTVSEIAAAAQLSSIGRIKLTMDADYYTSLPTEG